MPEGPMHEQAEAVDEARVHVIFDPRTFQAADCTDEQVSEAPEADK